MIAKSLRSECEGYRSCKVEDLLLITIVVDVFNERQDHPPARYAYQLWGACG